MDVQEMVGGVRDALNVKRVFGDPYEREGVTVIPVASVGGGGGGGGDNRPDGGGGGGFGISAKPAGVFVIRDGEVTWKPAIDMNRSILAGEIVAVASLFAIRSILRSRAKARMKSKR
jgi:uncharacterized spore protein YtfJ